MPRKKGKKNTAQKIIDEIIKLHDEQNLSKRELSMRFNLPWKTIGNMITRENNKKRKIAAGIVPRRSGRPRKVPITSEHSKELRIKELEREVELYKSFLRAAGRM